MDSYPLDYDEVIHETDKAVLFLIDDQEVWIPRSLIDGDPPEPLSGPGCVDVASWWLEKEGLV